MKNRYVPFGYCYINGSAVMVPTEQRIVCEIFRMYVDGLGYHAIATVLNNGTVQYKPNVPWNKHMVKRMLENRRYIGEKEFPPLISKETFRLAQDIRERKSQKPIHPKATDDALTEQLLYCGECAAPIPVGKRKILKCHSDGCSNGVRIEAAQILRCVTQCLEQLLSHKESILVPEIQKLPIPTAYEQAERSFQQERSRPQPEETTLTELSLRMAQALFDSADDGTHHHQGLRMRAMPPDVVTDRTLLKLSERITLQKNGTIVVHLKNGQKIEVNQCDDHRANSGG